MKSNKKIWLSSPHIGNESRRYVDEAFDLNWIAPVGPHIDQFEDKLSEIKINSLLKYIS